MPRPSNFAILMAKVRKKTIAVLLKTIIFLNSHCPDYNQAQAWLEKYGNSL